jgi:hypothetical protein
VQNQKSVSAVGLVCLVALVGWLSFLAGEQAARNENSQPSPSKIQSPAETEQQFATWASAHAALIAAKNNLDTEVVKKVLVAHWRVMTAAFGDPKADLIELANGGASEATIIKISDEVGVSKNLVGQILFDDQALQQRNTQ